MERTYKGYLIVKFRRSYRIYLNGQFMQTCSRLKDAKQRIDFCTSHGLWEDAV